MIYIIWLTLFALFIFSFINEQIPIWIPVAVYIIVVVFRIKEKIGNYNEWRVKTIRDEKLEIERSENELEKNGMLRSGLRLKNENKIRENFQWKLKERKRRFENELIDSLLLK